MKKFIFLLLIAALTVSVTSCASMFSSKLTNIPVKTTPENAKISLYTISGGKIFEGNTPCVIALNKKEVVDGKVVVSMQGYKDVEINLGRTVETWGFANACCLVPGVIIGGGIDFFSGNLVKPETDNINIILEPVTKKNSVKGMELENTLLSQNISINIQSNSSECLLFISE